MAITLAGVMTVCGAGVEAGHIYYAYRLLVSSTNAATLAGAQTMSTALLDTTSSAAYTTAVDNAVQQYSSMTGDYNASSFLHNDRIVTTNLYLFAHACRRPIQCSMRDTARQFHGLQRHQGDADGGGAFVVWGLARHAEDEHFGHSGGGDQGRTEHPLQPRDHHGHDSIDERLSKWKIRIARVADRLRGSGFMTMLENMYPCASGTTCICKHALRGRRGAVCVPRDQHDVQRKRL